METIDILIGVFAVVAVVGSVVGAALYEPSGVQDFRVTFATQEGTDTDSGRASGGTLTGADTDEVVLTHDLARSNMTQLTFEVALERGGTSSLTTLQWRAELFAPDGTSVDTDDGSMTGSATASLAAPAEHVAAIPEETALSGADRNAAANDAAERFTATNGTGEWTIELTITFPQGSAPTGTMVEAESTATYTYYEATVAPDVDVSGVA